MCVDIIVYCCGINVKIEARELTTCCVRLSDRFLVSVGCLHLPAEGVELLVHAAVPLVTDGRHHA